MSAVYTYTYRICQSISRSSSSKSVQVQGATWTPSHWFRVPLGLQVIGSGCHLYSTSLVQGATWTPSHWFRVPLVLQVIGSGCHLDSKSLVQGATWTPSHWFRVPLGLQMCRFFWSKSHTGKNESLGEGNVRSKERECMQQ